MFADSHLKDISLWAAPSTYFSPIVSTVCGQGEDGFLVNLIRPSTVRIQGDGKCV